VLVIPGGAGQAQGIQRDSGDDPYGGVARGWSDQSASTERMDSARENLSSSPLNIVLITKCALTWPYVHAL
jgi:hypothetical protein